MQRQIDELRKKADPMARQFEIGDARENVTNMRLEIVALSLQLAEISTRRIIWLTWALLAFTVALFAMESRKVFIGSARFHQKQVDEHQQRTALEVLEWRSQCNTLAENLLKNMIVNSDNRISQVSHCDLKNNRCFVLVTVQSADRSNPAHRQGKNLYDGQTGKLLAFVNIEYGTKTAMILDKDIRETGLFGKEELFEEASAYIDEKMKDD